MTKHRKGLTAARTPKTVRHCAYCGAKTRVTGDVQSTALARLPHSPEAQPVPPLCFVGQWMRAFGQPEQQWAEALRAAPASAKVGTGVGGREDPPGPARRLRAVAAL